MQFGEVGVQLSPAEIRVGKSSRLNFNIFDFDQFRLYFFDSDFEHRIFTPYIRDFF